MYTSNHVPISAVCFMTVKHVDNFFYGWEEVDGLPTNRFLPAPTTAYVRDLMQYADFGLVILEPILQAYWEERAKCADLADKHDMPWEDFFQLVETMNLIELRSAILDYYDCR